MHRLRQLFDCSLIAGGQVKVVTPVVGRERERETGSTPDPDIGSLHAFASTGSGTKKAYRVAKPTISCTEHQKT